MRGSDVAGQVALRQLLASNRHLGAGKRERKVVLLHPDAPTRCITRGLLLKSPYNVAQVDLEEGLRILTNIVDCSNADLHIGMSLEVTFEELSDEVTLPKFKPVG